MSCLDKFSFVWPDCLVDRRMRLSWIRNGVVFGRIWRKGSVNSRLDKNSEILVQDLRSGGLLAEKAVFDVTKQSEINQFFSKGRENHYIA